MRNITISPVLNGWRVQVGCQELAYTSREKLLLDLGDYLNDPKKTEERIIQTEGINRDHTLGRAVPPPAADCDQRPMVANECGTQDTPMGLGQRLR